MRNRALERYNYRKYPLIGGMDPEEDEEPEPAPDVPAMPQPIYPDPGPEAPEPEADTYIVNMFRADPRTREMAKDMTEVMKVKNLYDTNSLNSDRLRIKYSVKLLKMADTLQNKYPQLGIEWDYQSGIDELTQLMASNTESSQDTFAIAKDIHDTVGYNLEQSLLGEMQRIIGEDGNPMF